MKKRDYLQIFLIGVIFVVVKYVLDTLFLIFFDHTLSEIIKEIVLRILN